MALAAGEIVAPATSVTPAPGNSAVNDQVEMRGVVQKVNGNPVTDGDVLWASGLQEKGVLVGALDRIDPPTPASLALYGQLVRQVLDSGTGVTASAAYDGLVIELYKRTRAGTGTPTPDIALVKTLQNGSLFEVFAAALRVVT